ncbi:hypothetical protein PIB30_068850 [Stylosanthes scabra]|uniref:RRM domain-containing protein n=1 Tax=Stylosanthes scabra TaxID=79078 RepID=A0ABU6QP60_9FABA|nr:hypothetical protein [Stylosanthes scabra]
MSAGGTRLARAERGKHCEGLGPGDWKRTEPYTVFIDNLPEEVNKRALYKEFDKDGYILDVFISKKRRRNSNSVIAFIRYHAYGGAQRAINRLNGKLWLEAKLYVALSKYGRRSDVVKPKMKHDMPPTRRGVPKNMALPQKRRGVG